MWIKTIWGKPGLRTYLPHQTKAQLQHPQLGPIQRTSSDVLCQPGIPLLGVWAKGWTGRIFNVLPASSQFCPYCRLELPPIHGSAHFPTWACFSICLCGLHNQCMLPLEFYLYQRLSLTQILKLLTMQPCRQLGLFTSYLSTWNTLHLHKPLVCLPVRPLGTPWPLHSSL